MRCPPGLITCGDSPSTCGAIGGRTRTHRYKGLVTRPAWLHGAAALAVGGILAACGSAPEPPAARDSQEVATTVEAFNRDAIARDFRTICDQLLTASARAAAGGAGCPAQLGSGAASLKDTRLSLTSIILRGDQATATITATKRGSAATAETLQLVRAGHSFRIASAVGPPEE